MAPGGLDAHGDALGRARCQLARPSDRREMLSGPRGSASCDERSSPGSYLGGALAQLDGIKCLAQARRPGDVVSGHDERCCSPRMYSIGAGRTQQFPRVASSDLVRGHRLGGAWLVLPEQAGGSEHVRIVGMADCPGFVVHGRSVEPTCDIGCDTLSCCCSRRGVDPASGQTTTGAVAVTRLMAVPTVHPMCRSSRGRGSPAVGRLVAEELIEVTAVSHLAKPGQSSQPHEPLAHLTQGGVHRVLLGREHRLPELARCPVRGSG
jgi:hypothetical protein